jgi:hypothetical protein
MNFKNHTKLCKEDKTMRFFSTAAVAVATAFAVAAAKADGPADSQLTLG